MSALSEAPPVVPLRGGRGTAKGPDGMGAAPAGAGRTSSGTNTARCGAELREARERLGWDLGEIAAALRIRHAYLQAIEDGHLSALPGNTYALGFLRTYATTLGLDADDVARRFRAEAIDVNRRTELAFPSPVPERGVPTGAALLTGFVILLLAYVAWFHFSAHERAPTRTVPPVPPQLLASHRAAPVSPQVASVMPATPGPALPAPPSNETAASTSAGPGEGAATPSRSRPVGAAGVPEAASAGNGSASGLTATGTPSVTAPPPPGMPAATAPATVAPEAAVAGAPAPVAAPELTVLQASAPTWLEIRDASGAAIFDRVLQTGERWVPPAGATGLFFTTGNAGGLELVRNGVGSGPLGRNGAVLRHVALDGAVPPRPGPVPAGTALPDQGAAAAAAPAAHDAGGTASSAIAPAPAAAPGAAPALAPPDGADQVPGVAPAPAIRHRATRPNSPPDSDNSADSLNARELGAHTASPPPGH